MSDDRIWQLLRVKLPPISRMLSAPKVVMFGAFSTTILPVTARTSGMLIASVVPVATAMLPEKVSHEARAVASPEFWMVRVPDALHAD